MAQFYNPTILQCYNGTILQWHNHSALHQLLVFGGGRRAGQAGTDFGAGRVRHADERQVAVRRLEGAEEVLALRVVVDVQAHEHEGVRVDLHLAAAHQLVEALAAPALLAAGCSRPWTSSL